MMVMNDQNQVPEPQNVEPSMVQMTFLEDVPNTSLKEGESGATARRRSCSTQTTNTFHGHYTLAQTSSRPGMSSQTPAPKQNPFQLRSSRLNRRKDSDSSVSEEERTKDDPCDYLGPGGNGKSRNKHFLKRRKFDGDGKKLNLKRFRTDISDYSESSDSENSDKRMTSSSEPNAEYERKSRKKSKLNGDEVRRSLCHEGADQQTLDSLTLWGHIHEEKKRDGSEHIKPATFGLPEKPLFSPTEDIRFYSPNANDLRIQDCTIEKPRTELIQKGQFVCKTPTPNCVIDITNETGSEKVIQENPMRTFGFQPLQKPEHHISDSHLLFSSSKFLEVRKPEPEKSWVNSIINKMDLASSAIISPLSLNDHPSAEKEKDPFTTYRSTSNASPTDDGPLLKPDILKPKFGSSLDASKPKTNPLFNVMKPKLTLSPPDPLNPKARFPPGILGAGERRTLHKTDLPRSSFHPVTPRGSKLDPTTSPLIVDKSDHFTVYRDPALVGQETAPNHNPASFGNQHTYCPHSSTQRTCLNPSGPHPNLSLSTPVQMLAGSSNQNSLPSLSHPVTPAAHPPVHHPHLLPTVLPGVPQASILTGHPRPEAAHASSLSRRRHHHQRLQLGQLRSGVFVIKYSFDFHVFTVYFFKKCCPVNISHTRMHCYHHNFDQHRQCAPAQPWVLQHGRFYPLKKT